MKYHTGTCSWAEKALIESHEFYPPDVDSAEDRLRYYSSQFDTVEVDSTYYAIPRPQNAVLWSSLTPDRRRKKTTEYTEARKDCELLKSTKNKEASGGHRVGDINWLGIFFLCDLQFFFWLRF